MPETKARHIAGIAFALTWPFAEGHTITAAEAKALNQVRSENIGNNLRKQIEEAVAAGKSETEIADLVAKYDSEYVFTLAGVGGGSRALDPIEREARAIAKEVLRAHLAKTGRKINKTPEGETDDSWAEKIEGHIDALIAKDEVVKEAKRRVNAKAKATENILAGMESVS